MSSIKTIGNINDESVVLISNDGEHFKVNVSTANHSNTIKDMIEIFTEDGPIPLPKLSGTIVEKVMIFCDYIENNPDELDKLKPWLDDTTFIHPLPKWFSDFIDVKQSVLFEIINAANFLDIQPLLNLGCKYVAKMIRYNTPEELRILFASQEQAASS